MQITIDILDTLAQTETFNQNDWMREIAIALFQQEQIILSRASKIAGMELMDFQALMSDRTAGFAQVRLATKACYK